jgi:GAF domain-containing protein
LAVWILLGFVSACFLVPFIILSKVFPGNDPVDLDVGVSLLHNFFPRWFFFVVVVGVAFERQRKVQAKNEELLARREELLLTSEELLAKSEELRIKNEELLAKREELDAVHGTAIKISNNEALETRLEAVIDAAIQLLKAKGCIVYLCLPERDMLELVALKGLDPHHLDIGYLLPYGHGMAGAIVRDNLPSLYQNKYSESKYRVEELSDKFEAVIEVPLLFGNTTIGVLAVFDTQPHEFGEDDIPVLQRLAQYAAVAIHEMQVVEQLRKQNEAAQIIGNAGRSMNSTLDMNTIWSAAVENAWHLSGLYNTPPIFTYLAQLSRDGQYLELVATHPPTELVGLQARVGRIDFLKDKLIGIIGTVVKSKQSERISNVKPEVVTGVVSAYIEFHPDTRSQVAVPIKDKHGKVVGVLSVEHREEYAFPLELQTNLESLALQATAAIENAKLFAETTLLQQEQARILLEIANNRKLEDVAGSVLDALYRIVPYARATFQIFDGDNRRLLAIRGFGQEEVDDFLLRPISEDELLQEVLEGNKISILSPPHEHKRWDKRRSTGDILAWTGIPLVYGKKPLGVITVDELQPSGYTEQQSRLLELFAQYVTSVLQNAISFQQNVERVAELTEARDSLRIMMRFFQSYYNLALIGVVYGEDIHYAKNLLGMAAARASRIAEGRISSSEDIKKSAALIVSRVERYLLLVDELERAALRSPDHVRFNLHAMLDHVISSKRIGSNILVTQDYKASSSTVFAPRQLRQVFLVIIQNALDSMSSGGVLTLGTEIEERDGTRYIRVSVSDTGTGIPEDLQKNLFAPRIQDGHRTNRRGTGLGLPWAYAFMRVYRGDITFSTSPEKGTTMYVLVPEDFRKVMPLPLNAENLRNLIARLERVTDAD